MKRQLRRWLGTLRVAWGRLGWNFSRFFRQVGRLFGWMFWRVGRWVTLRRSRHLLKGLPAVLGVVGVGVVAGMIFFTSQDQRIQRYQQQGGAALQAGNAALAQICFERLAQLDAGRPEFRFWLALAVQTQGESEYREAVKAEQAGNLEQAKTYAERARTQFERAAAMMGQLAAPDKQGHAPAHIWWAQRLIATRNPSAVTVGEMHLRRALQEQPDNAAANALMGQVLLATNRADQAEKPLRKALPAQPALNLDLARLYAAKGDKELAKAHGEKARHHFKDQADANVDNHAARAQWHEACLFLGDFPGAVRVLEEGLRLSNNASYRPALARAFVLWSDAVARLGKTDEKEKKEPPDKALKIDEATRLTSRIGLLERALQYDFGNATALTRLVELTHSKDGAEAEKARVTLRSLLAAGKHQATIHLVMGMDAQRNGQIPEAREHFEQAYKLSPDMPIVVNNLAWTMAFADKPDLKGALELIEGALKKQPANARFRETRGQVLVKMGKYQDALPDLEAGLRVMSGNRELHRALAETYRELGNPAMADEHRRLAGAGPEAVGPPAPKP